MEWKSIKCKRCGYEWYPRTPKTKPVMCPACKSRLYEVEKKSK